MSQPDSGSSPDPTKTSHHDPAGAAIRIAATLAVTLLATGISYLILKSVGTVYPTPPEMLGLSANPTLEDHAAAHAAQLAANSGNAAIRLSIIAAVIGSLTALTSGLLRKSGPRIIAGVIAGVLLGGGIGFFSGTLAVQSHQGISDTEIVGSSDAETKFMLMHGVTWLLIGLAVGLACEVGNRSATLKSLAVALLVGGVMGGIAGVGFPLAVALAAPLLDSTLPVPAIGTGLIVFVGLGALLIAIGVDQATTGKE